MTGTDTGVGRTLVAAGILRWLRKQGIDAVPMKPVQTGAERRSGMFVSPDLEYCISASGMVVSPQDLGLMSPYLFEPACSPHLAGKMAGLSPQISNMTVRAERLLELHRAIVVEGAGGIMVPLNENETMLDLMKKLGYPVVLVSRVGLGAINHALLSIRALRDAHLTLVGIVFNRPQPSLIEDRFIEEDNPGTIARMGGVEVLGNLAYFESTSQPGAIWNQFEESMPGLQRIREATGL